MTVVQLSRFPVPERLEGRRIALVGCGKAKLDRPAPARELYTSNLFRLSVRWAEQFCDGWYVVSARHGLIEPDKVVAPYDYSLAQMRERDLDRWLDGVLGRLAYREHAARFVVLAGGRYTRLARRLRWTTVEGVNFCPGLVDSVEEPLEGMGIGQRLGWLKHDLEAVS